jgi:hypothetical protein
LIDVTENPIPWVQILEFLAAMKFVARERSLKDGAFGFCFDRRNVSGQMVLNPYGRTGFCVDPVEKKSGAIFVR